MSFAQIKHILQLIKEEISHYPELILILILVALSTIFLGSTSDFNPLLFQLAVLLLLIFSLASKHKKTRVLCLI